MAKKTFRNNFIEYFENHEISDFVFYKYERENLAQFVSENFKIFNGKCFSLNDNNTLLIALHKEDIGEGSLKELLQEKTKLELAHGSKDVFKIKKESTNTKVIPYPLKDDEISLAAEDTTPYKK